MQFGNSYVITYAYKDYLLIKLVYALIINERIFI